MSEISVTNYVNINKKKLSLRLSVELRNVIMMKNKFLIQIAAVSFSLLAACGGDHSTHVVRDTTANQYGTDTAKVEKSNIDTSKITSPDNSASGGTKAAKDSSKKK
ncbi:MAG TPA: hypothetical protein VGM63_02995 [Mucilaginibacter sp.]|jgi:hypothetical protein